MTKRGVCRRVLKKGKRSVGEGFLEFVDHVANLGGHGSLRLDAKIFLVFAEGPGAVAQLQQDIGEKHVGGGEIG